MAATAEPPQLKLHVRVVRARGLTAMDVGGTSDPYVDVSLGHGKPVGRTPTIKSTLDPVWTSGAEFDVLVPRGCTYLALRVWDEDFGSRDDLIGCVRLLLRDLPLHAGQEWWLPLRVDTELAGVPGVSGDLCVRVELDAATAHASASAAQLWPPSLADWLRAVRPDAARSCDADSLLEQTEPFSSEAVLAVLDPVLAQTHVGTPRPLYLGQLLLTPARLLFVPTSGRESIDAAAAAVASRHGAAGGAGAAGERADSVDTADATRYARMGALVSMPLRGVSALRVDGAALTVLCPDTAHADIILRSEAVDAELSLQSFVAEAVWLIAEDSMPTALALGDAATREVVEGDTPEASAEAGLGSGWGKYNVAAEFARQGITEGETSTGWRLSAVNHDFEVSPTYPSLVAVPAAISDEDVAKAAEFRTKKRFPALSWRHPTNGASIMRSSQPRAGLLGRTGNLGDKAVLSAVRRLAKRQQRKDDARGTDIASPGGPDTVAPVVNVCDCRPQLNAYGNRLKGGGFSRGSTYVEASGSDSEADVAETAGTRATLTRKRRKSRWSPRVLYGGGLTPLPVAVSDDEVEATEDAELIDADDADDADDAGEAGDLGGAVSAALAPVETVVAPTATPERPRAVLSRPASGKRAAQQFVQVTFLGIQNIHAVRRSLRAVRDARDGDATQFHAAVAASGWLSHLSSIVRGALRAAHFVNEGQPVLVHCSDGWDRTSQITALSQLLLDPYYRTVDGFAALIEKDWLGFGHMFETRCCCAVSAREVAFRGAPDRGFDATHWHEHSPIFLQFLDAVWQVLRQWPDEFEFGELYLVAVALHCYSGWFGTFSGNCERDRVVRRLASRTRSLWAFVDAHRHWFVANPAFVAPGTPGAPGHEVRFIRTVETRKIVVWDAMYLRSEPPSRARGVDDAVRMRARSSSEMDELAAEQRLRAELQRRLQREQNENEELRRRVRLLESGVAGHGASGMETPLLRREGSKPDDRGKCCTIS